MAGVFHLDTDFLIHALSTRGPERRRLHAVIGSDATVEISAIAWYEFARGPRTPEQLAVARDLFAPEGVIPFSEILAIDAAEQFRRLGSPRKRGNDIAIGVVARSRDALLLTRNAKDFVGIVGLRVEGTLRSRA
jgi:predicted nucleic acid-binding protein